MGNGVVADQGNAVYHIPTVGAADHGNDGKPLAGAKGGIADLGVQGTGESAAHADICPAGCRGGWAGEEEIRLALGVLARLRTLGLLLLRGGLGHGPPLPRSSQGSDRGIWLPLGHRWAVAISNPRC